MKALVFDGARLELRDDYPEPEPRPGWALIDVRAAGVCRTDLEIRRGYMGFKGVLGHEFVGEVRACGDPAWIGKRVVGEINAACGQCDVCAAGLGRHCASRLVLGILALDGCMAERCSLPVSNLREVPPEIPDEQAVFVEPLSAAFEIAEQVPFTGSERCIVLGDGKLGILCAWVLSTVAGQVTLVGRHPDKLALAEWGGVNTALAGELEAGADVVVDATGRSGGLAEAIGLCRPRGTLVLKSTVADAEATDLSPVVINEIQIVGSRCGPFERGLDGMLRHRFPVQRLIAGRYPFDRAIEAFENAGRPGALKVLLEMC